MSRIKKARLDKAWEMKVTLQIRGRECERGERKRERREERDKQREWEIKVTQQNNRSEKEERERERPKEWLKPKGGAEKVLSKLSTSAVMHSKPTHTRTGLEGTHTHTINRL